MIRFNKKKTLQELEFPKEINISEENYRISVDFFPKKSSSVSIKNRTINFRMSSYLSKKEAEEHFSYLLEKIHKKIEVQNKIKPTLTFNEVFERGYFTFANELYKFEFKKIRGIKLIENIFYINPTIKKETIEKKVIKLLIEKYEHRIQEYVKQVNINTYNFHNLGNISLRLVNSKWGHCTGKNDIMINLKLLNAPVEVLNYVVIHELAHIKHKNHSITYWKFVSIYCPNYKVLRKSLKLLSPEVYY